ncbi:hypothetical protein L3Q82_011472 [Scortum barcoo]|uniref:Uncharacterized protein n=1 Tax=Scortum barcoo TaxID=214431 RepID=A0ACB8WAB3_9TELE|nr:hypothetical protein L3Q82_011472 [Scortum barcoo]
MGYQRSVWGSLAGGGEGVAVVRCSCSEEEVKISFRSVGEDRRLRRVFVCRWFGESLLSVVILSTPGVQFVSSTRQSPCHPPVSPQSPPACPPLPSAVMSALRRPTPSDSSDRRPASLISTLSSGSGSSRDDNLAPPPSSQTPNIDLDLSLAGGAAEGEGGAWPHPEPERKGQYLSLNNNTEPSQTSCRPTSPLNRSMAPNPQLTYLDRVVMEIIETERMYVRDLRMIVEVSHMVKSQDYLAHIIDQCDLSIRPEQVCALFGNIEDIYEFNSELLQALDLCDNDPVAIARCFVMKSEYFEIYTQYCTNYPNSVAALTECMRNKSLAKFFRERQASLKRSLPLGSYLLKPVQRILKYHLLLQEIAKHFDPEESGYEVVEEAIYTMTGVAWYINDMKRKHEHAVRLQEVQSLLLNWKGPDLTTYGELVLEGTFKVHRAKNERTLFLFDRLLLITKRRGEHFVYKNHISCSTLMLIESAKDSLSFSVTHYKHPKQPHTVQAKTVEEKKLWAHHIKRIILENHHAIIPQKAKEAILEMNSIYPPRYRYSPERLKKALSQSDEFPRDGRRQSGPLGPRGAEQTVQHFFLISTTLVLKTCNRNRSGVFDVLQHSEGASPGGRREEEEELGSRKDSLERLICSEEEEDEGVGRLSPQQSQTAAEDSEPDEILLEEQVDDFASSVLAALSCWHFRAQALLSTGVTMVTEAEGGSVSANDCNKENGRHPEEDQPGGTVPTYEQPTTEKLPQQKMSESEPTEQPEHEPPSDLESLSATPPRISLSPQRSEELKLERDPDPTEEPSSATPDSDLKTLSSGESSEDEEDEKGAPQKEGEATSILPSSVLDKASAIAQHFTNSIKRSSLSQEDARSLGCASPRLPSRTSSCLSLSTEPTDRTLRLNSVCSDPSETFGMTDLTLLSPRDDSLFEADRGIRRRRDSTLSKQDQLLIGKIKSYYENAENQDATFSLQRRESLTYIPTGLVRSSVSRFNRIPNDETIQTNPPTSTTSPSFGPSATESNSALPTDTQSCMVISDSLDSLKSDQNSTDPEDSQSLQDNPSEDEEFRPSSEMIKIWQMMERDINKSQSDDRRREQSREAPRNSRVTNISFSDTTKTSFKSCDEESGVSDLSTITEESTSPLPFKHKASGVNRSGSLKDALKAFGEEAVVLKAPVPRVAQLKAEAEGERPSEASDQLDDVDKMKSKVLHLARQYSQRIKTTKPVVRQRSQGILIGKKSLPCVVEEKESAGKPDFTFSLVSHKKATSLPLIPVDQVRALTPGLTSGSLGSSRVVSPSRARSRSPLSPLSPPLPIESFNWPDVRELRSKYSDHGRPQKSRSIPEQMFDGGLRRHSSCSSTDGASGGASFKPCGSWDASREERSRRLHRANSLDPRLSGAQMTELQKLQDQVANDNCDGYYIAAEAPLPDKPEHKIIVMEKLPEPESEPVEAAKEQEEEGDDNYIQIRSPTSREKISIMAVIDRCRVYQDSDEYKQREEAKAKTEPGRPQELDAAAASLNDQDDEYQKTSSSSRQNTEASQLSIVKNLREKFQSLG